MIAENNPFNIRHSCHNRWVGQNGLNKGFVTFDCLDHGLRAGFILLRNYVYKLDLNTVEKVVSRFAPAIENNTSSYISYVSDVLRHDGFSPNHLRNNFELRYDKCFYSLCRSMLKMENGFNLLYIDFIRICTKFNIGKPYVICDEDNS